MESPGAYHQDGPIAIVTLNRPETRNAFTDRPVVDALVSAIERLNADPHIRAALLTAQSPARATQGHRVAIAAVMKKRTSKFEGQ